MTGKPENRCVATVYPRDKWGAFHGHKCGKPGTLEHDGGWYCKLHHPPTAAAREAAKPKCSVCSATVLGGAKYCSSCATVRVSRDKWDAMVAEIAELRLAHGKALGMLREMVSR